MFQHTILEIKKNLLHVLDDIIGSRQYLNKHFQNSMNNYFLENYATLSCLKKKFGTQSGRQVRKEVYEKYNAKIEKEGRPEGSLKCFLIMKGFIEEHSLNNSLNEYRAFLANVSNASESAYLEEDCPEWISMQWRRLFALMVLHHTHYPEISGVYELWFHIFDERLIARERQKKKKEEIIPRKGIVPYILNKQEEKSLLKNEPISNLVTLVSMQSFSNNDDQNTHFSEQREDSEPLLQKKRKTQDTIILLQEQNSQFNQIPDSPTTLYDNNPILLNQNYEASEQFIGYQNEAYPQRNFINFEEYAYEQHASGYQMQPIMNQQGEILELSNQTSQNNNYYENQDELQAWGEVEDAQNFQIYHHKEQLQSQEDFLFVSKQQKTLNPQLEQFILFNPENNENQLNQDVYPNADLPFFSEIPSYAPLQYPLSTQFPNSFYPQYQRTYTEGIYPFLNETENIQKQYPISWQSYLPHSQKCNQFFPDDIFSTKNNENF